VFFSRKFRKWPPTKVFPSPTLAGAGRRTLERFKSLPPKIGRLFLLSGKMSVTPIVCRFRWADFGMLQKFAAQSRQTFEAAILLAARFRQDVCDASSLLVTGRKMFPPPNSRALLWAKCRQPSATFSSRKMFARWGLANYLERNCFAARDPQIVGNGQCWQDVPAWLNFTCLESTL